MTIYCTYITFYSGNKLPPFYIGATYVDNIFKNGYNGSVSSKKYKQIWIKERKENPQLFNTKVVKTFTSMKDARKHEEFLQLHFNVHINPLYSNMAIGKIKFNMDDLLEKGKHHFQNSKWQSDMNFERIKENKHHFQNSEFQRSLGQRAKSKPEFHERQSKQTSEMNKRLIENGTHNLLGCGEFMRTLNNKKLNRECVKRLKEIITNVPTKLGTGWWRKSDDWVSSKILELTR